MSENEYRRVSLDDMWALLRVTGNSLATAMQAAPPDLPEEAAYKIGVATGAIRAAVSIIGAYTGADAATDNPVRDQQKREDVIFRMMLSTLRMAALERTARLELMRTTGQMPTHTTRERAMQRLTWVREEIAARKS